MATPIWPVSLQQYVDTDSFSMSYGETVLRSDNETGPTKVRRRFTRGIDTFSAGIVLRTPTEYTTFETFYKVTTNGGATVFQFTHPISRLPFLVRFRAPPAFTPLGGFVFQVAFELEIQP